MRRRDSKIKLFRKRFEVDIGCIHVFEKLRTRFGGYVTCGNGHCLDTDSMTGNRRVNRVFCPDYGIVVSEGDTAAARAQRSLGNSFRRRFMTQSLDLARFRDIPVLAEFAAQIAARCSERQDRRARKKMIERFLLDGVDAKPSASPVGIEHHLPLAILAYKAKAFISRIQMTMPGTQLAENFLRVGLGGIFQACPPLSGNCPIRVLQSNHKIELKFRGGASVRTRAR